MPRYVIVCREVSKELSLPLPPKTLFKTPLPLNLHYKILVKTPIPVTTYTTLTNIHPCGPLRRINGDVAARGRRPDDFSRDNALGFLHGAAVTAFRGDALRCRRSSLTSLRIANREPKVVLSVRVRAREYVDGIGCAHDACHNQLQPRILLPFWTSTARSSSAPLRVKRIEIHARNAVPAQRQHNGVLRFGSDANGASDALSLGSGARDADLGEDVASARTLKCA
ncbi:hypothetical protein ON010_g3640 [Phytophthora cinnamomi]|nr:hypothetical protein ON010_g3640 [Phytophthora cinnamomi]